MASIKCPHCGKFIKSGSSYCIMCGATLRTLDSDEGNEPETAPSSTEKGEPPKMQRMASLTQPAKPPVSPVKPESPISSSAVPKTRNSSPNLEEAWYEESEEELEEAEDFPETDGREEEDTDQGYDTKGIAEESWLQEDDEDDEEEEEEEDPEDDEEAFARLMCGEQEGPESPEKPKEKASKKAIPAFAIENLKKNLTGFDNGSKKKQVDKKRKAQKPGNEEENAYEEDTILYEDETIEEIDKDQYYEDIISEVDKRISHIKKDSLVHAISVVAIFTIILVFMIYCIVL